MSAAVAVVDAPAADLEQVMISGSLPVVDAVASVTSEAMPCQDTLLNDPAPTEAVHQSYASRLKCFTLHATMEERPEMTIGYPLHIYRDSHGRFRMDLIADLVSYEGNESAAVRNTPSGVVRDVKMLEANHSLCYIGMQYYNAWLPIYVNANHFARARDLIEKTISVLARGAVHETAIHNRKACKSPFKPSMVLDVLPSLMNKMMYRMIAPIAVNRAASDIRAAAMVAFSQLLRLFAAMLETYPTLQQELDSRCQKFRQDPKYRCKDNVPDLGAFLIQSSFSNAFSLIDMKKELVDEWFVRQIVWMFRNDTSSASSGTVIHSQLMALNGRPNYPLQACFKATETANKLLVLYWYVLLRVFNFTTAQNGRTQVFEMDERSGLVSDSQRDMINQFLDTIDSRIKCYSDVWPLIEMADAFKTDEDVQMFLLRCERKSFDCGYHGKKVKPASSGTAHSVKHHSQQQQKRPSRGR